MIFELLQMTLSVFISTDDKNAFMFLFLKLLFPIQCPLQFFVGHHSLTGVSFFPHFDDNSSHINLEYLHN